MNSIQVALSKLLNLATIVEIIYYIASQLNSINRKRHCNIVIFLKLQKYYYPDPCAVAMIVLPSGYFLCLLPVELKDKWLKSYM